MRRSAQLPGPSRHAPLPPGPIKPSVPTSHRFPLSRELQTSCELPSSHQCPSRRAQLPSRTIERWHHCRHGPSPSRPLPPGPSRHAPLPSDPVKPSVSTSNWFPSSRELQTSRELPSSHQRPSHCTQLLSRPIERWHHCQHGPLPSRPLPPGPSRLAQSPLRPIVVVPQPWQHIAVAPKSLQPTKPLCLCRHGPSLSHPRAVKPQPSRPPLLGGCCRAPSPLCPSHCAQEPSRPRAFELQSRPPL